MFDVIGKVAVVTGGASGIGLSVVQRLRRAGAAVFIADRRDAGSVADELGARFVRTDVSQEDDVKALMAAAATAEGRIDILVNSAGIFSDPENIENLSLESMTESFAVNVLGPMYGMKHAVRYMQAGGAIINVTSLAGISALPEYGAYCAAKFAANGLTLCAALELGSRGIRVNAICPPSVNTPMLRAQENAAVEIAVTRTASALDRIIEPEDVAALIHFLASDDCPSFSGQLIRLDAGMNAGFSPALLSALATGVCADKANRAEVRTEASAGLSRLSAGGPGLHRQTRQAT